MLVSEILVKNEYKIIGAAHILLIFLDVEDSINSSADTVIKFNTIRTAKILTDSS